MAKISYLDLLTRWRHNKIAKRKGVCVTRYGGFGDMLQTASVLPLLKEKYGRVTVNTTSRGLEILKHDPHIDEFIIQESNQVKNEDLGEYWGKLADSFDHFINFSESVEGTWLAMPGRVKASWPHEVRHKYLNTNYLEFMHDLAGVDFQPAVKFYPTKEEKAWARKQRKKIGGRVMLYPLSGSSSHKFWPHQDGLVARLMLEHPDVRVVFVGDFACQILESGWEKEKRVFRKSGVWDIRKTLAFAQECDLIFGCETGVLNCVSMEEVPKVCILSHSSVENLTKHWVNTTSLIPRVPCYPCHTLHYTWDYCHQDKDTGASICAVSVSLDDAYDAVKGYL